MIEQLWHPGAYEVIHVGQGTVAIHLEEVTFVWGRDPETIADRNLYCVVVGEGGFVCECDRPGLQFAEIRKCFLCRERAHNKTY